MDNLMHFLHKQDEAHISSCLQDTNRILIIIIIIHHHHHHHHHQSSLIFPGDKSPPSPHCKLYQHHPFREEQGEEGIIDLPKFINLFNQVTDMLAKESAVFIHILASSCSFFLVGITKRKKKKNNLSAFFIDSDAFQKKTRCILSLF